MTGLTFTESFKTLEEAWEIIHKILVDNHLTKYAIDDVISLKKAMHISIAIECHSVQCLESVSLRSIKLPEGFAGTETEVLIKGTCAACKDQFAELL
jgi:Fe2+ or Zn2+ uptake regulation protein